MTADITRLFVDRDTRYHALVRQQGRLPIDAEENFASDIAEWERDDAFVETIAPCGTPNDGFRITLPVGGPTADFTIGAGSYYLGGLRIENPVALTYRQQASRNWIPFAMDAEGSNEAIGAARQFLVWLDAVDDTVTATEDAELRDPGIGTPDGAAAKRMSWRVRATAVPGPDCSLARQQWLAAQDWTGKVDDSGKLRSNAVLSVGYDPAAAAQDLCSPALTPGFLGARNECLRVTATSAGRYVWGRDDAAPLYRVKVEAIDGQLRRIVFLNQPRDDYVRPRAGQTIELLRWDQLLPNGQKSAERVGKFFTVSTGYSNKAITLTTPVDTAMTNWLNALATVSLSAEDPLNDQRYFYLRVWSGGGRNSQPDNALADGELTGTGLDLTFTGTPMAGDSWVIAARPNAPQQLLPWALKVGMRPAAPRRHVVPLAFVDLDTGKVIDCRRRFRALYKQGGCCTVTVGDNQNSWGDVSTISEALERLPASGGEICLGPGTWNENVAIAERSNVTISGCGRRTRWLPENVGDPLLSLLSADNVTVRRLTMESADAPCIWSTDEKTGEPSSGIIIEDCTLTTPSGGVIRAEAVNDVRICRCDVTSGPMNDPLLANAAIAAISLAGESLSLIGNTIRADKGKSAQELALGGIHIKGGSRDVQIADNRIQDGAGNGITLGSVHMVTIPIEAFDTDPDKALADAVSQWGGNGLPGFVVTIDEAGCIRLDPVNPDPDDKGDGTIDVPISDGAVSRVRIAGNLIARCGANGIATFPLLPVNEKGEPAWDAVAVEELMIEHNEIVDNVRREVTPLPGLQQMFVGAGGISLATAIDLTARDNEISGNGLEPARVASGLFVGYSEGLRVIRNRIERNGSVPATLPTASGGIVVRVAMGGMIPAAQMSANVGDRPALQIEGNVVHAPAGRALKALAWGPVMINGNRLTGANPSNLFANPLQAIILFILGAQSAFDVINNPDDPNLTRLFLFDAMLDFLGGDAVNLVNLAIVEERLLVYQLQRLSTNFASALATGNASLPVPLGTLRGGETLVSDNQISLRGGPRQSRLSGHFSSVLVVTLDDLGFADNQCEAEPDVAFLLADALLIGTTLRVSSNRFQEPVFCAVSLASAGLLMNDTTHNQGTFVITADCANSSKLVSDPNTTLV